MSEEKITEEELQKIVEAANIRSTKTQVAERAVLEAKNAELSHTVIVQHVFMKYGLTAQDRIDDATGVITRGGFVKSGDASSGASVGDAESVAEAKEESAAE